MMDQEFCIFGGVDVVGYYSYVDVVVQGLVEGEGEGGFVGVDGVVDVDVERGFVYGFMI